MILILTYMRHFALTKSIQGDLTAFWQAAYRDLI